MYPEGRYFRFYDVLKKIAYLLIYIVDGLRRKNKNGLTIVTYHRVDGYDKSTDPLVVSIPTFRKQVEHYKKYYKIISADELATVIQGKQVICAPLCLITFDDGWRDNYVNAFEILKSYGVPAIIFVSTEHIGNGDYFWFARIKYILENIECTNINELTRDLSNEVRNHLHEIASLQKNQRCRKIEQVIEIMKNMKYRDIEKVIDALSDRYATQNVSCERVTLSWDEIREMINNGISFGTHGKRHAILTLLDDHELEREINDSKEQLEANINTDVKYIAYPNGNYDDRVIRFAKKYGYVAAFTCNPGINRLVDKVYEIRRCFVSEKSSEGLCGRYSDLFFNVELSGIRHDIRKFINRDKNNL